MNKPGRPSYVSDDYKHIVSMAENWITGGSRCSISSLATKCVKLNYSQVSGIHKKGKVRTHSTNESKAKRLAKLFSELNKKDLIVPVSVYRSIDIARYRYLQTNVEGITLGPYFEHHMNDSKFTTANEKAKIMATHQFNISIEEVDRLSTLGLKILKMWLPITYPNTRI